MWREITEDDVLSVLNAVENAAYQAAAAGSGQDVLGEITVKVVQHCRGYIAGHVINRLAEGDTLPERCIRPALHIIRKDMLTRLDLEVSKDRETDAREAVRFFERVEEGKVAIEQPTGATDDSSATPNITVVQSGSQKFTRETLGGL